MRFDLFNEKSEISFNMSTIEIHDSLNVYVFFAGHEASPVDDDEKSDEEWMEMDGDCLRQSLNKFILNLYVHTYTYIDILILMDLWFLEFYFWNKRTEFFCCLFGLENF